MSLLFAELTATCNALGYAVAGKNKYLLDNECKEAIRELIRFLRRDDETHEIRRYLGTAKILQTDLVPILIHRHSNEEILDLLLRLLVNLTTPALLLYNEELPMDKTSRQYYLSILQSLQDYKQAFADKNLWTVLSEKLTSLLALEWHDRGEEKSLIIVRILILVRNILHVPVDTDLERRPDNDASIHDQVLWALHEGGMINLILYIAASENEQQYYFHVLEITSLMLRDQNAEVLASASVQRSDEEKQRDVQELMAVRKKETEDKQKKMKKHIAARHSRFGGIFVVKGVKAIGDNDLVVHSLNNQITSSFDKKKNKLKTPKNRLPMQCDVFERRSAFSVRVLMKEFCIEFLNGAYNSLMRYIREMFARGKAQSNDESYYFWAMRFFMQFNRCYKFEVKLISETMSVQIFHFVQERLEDWRANLIMDKKKIPLWSKRMHLALKAYQELLNTLMKMYQSDDTTVRESAHTIMSNIFYVVEYRELLMSLLNLFDEIKFSKEYLKDLIESNHIFMKMLEHYCKRHKALVVQKKPKIVKRKKKPRKSTKQTEDLMDDCTEEKWNEMESKIADIVENGAELTVQSLPFDAASDVSLEEQKIQAMRRIRSLLLKNETEEAVGLFRASREVWPENDCFGSSAMSKSEECGAMKEIFFSDIGLPTETTASNEESESDESEESENEEAQAANVQISEQSFKFEDFAKKFAKPKIVQACCLLLSQFEKNTTFTNHCVLKLLHRIAFDCKYAAILFQASVFRTFQRILDSTEEQHKDLKKFAVFIVRKFVEVAKKNDKVYIELLFWKGHKEAYEIEEGYGSLTASKSHKVAWTEEQEDELRRLFAEYENNRPEQDVVDWIHANLIDQTRSRKSLMKKLRELYLIVGPKERKAEKITVTKEVENPTHCLVSMQVFSCVNAVLNAGMKDALNWIETALNEVLEEIGDDEADVPLLPLADYSIQAMDDNVFQNFLKSIGIKPPADFQETYWRIPGTWLANDIRKRIYLIKSAENGGNYEDIEINNSKMNNVDENDSRLGSEPEIESSPSRLNDIDDNVQNNDQEIDDNSNSVQGNKTNVGLKRKRLDLQNFLNNQQRKPKKKKIRRIVDDDNDIVENIHDGVSSMDNNDVVNRSTLQSDSDSDIDDISKKKTKSFGLRENDDSEPEFSSRPFKKVTALDSDSE